MPQSHRVKRLVTIPIESRETPVKKSRDKHGFCLRAKKRCIGHLARCKESRAIKA